MSRKPWQLPHKLSLLPRLSPALWSVLSAIHTGVVLILTTICVSPSL